ncbi:MAG: amidase [Xanthomonadales bacterium]|nr:amidase [Xanthomonadales bacterium]
MSATPEAEALRREDASAQLAALRAGRVSATALLEAHLAAIGRLEPRIRAFWQLDAEGARAQAAASDRRLARGRPRALEGLCLAVKDNLEVAGLPTTAGMATRRGLVAAQDARAVAALRAAGAIVLGKLAMDEAALGAEGDNPHFGRCHNPHRPGHSPGGSSGGSAAAVAAGLCALALGSDSLGSVRIPGAYCGVFALKPSLGRVSTRGLVPVSARLDCVGWLARSARDLALPLRRLAGQDPGCPASLPLPLPPPPRRRLRLRIPALAVALEAAVAQALERAAAALAELGHALERDRGPPVDPGPWRRAGLLLCEAELLVHHDADWRARRELFSPRLASLLAWAERRSAVELARALARIDEARRWVQAELARADALLLPTTPQRAFAFAAGAPADQAELSCLASLAGCPALQLPVPGEGLPAGVQLIAAPGRERLLLSLAEALSRRLLPAVPPVEPPP